MALKTMKLKKNNFELVNHNFFKKFIQWLRKYYLYVLFITGSLIIIYLLTTLFVHVAQKQKKKEVKKYIIISYNKILYKNKEIKNKSLLQALSAYESGYMEKSKFLFQSSLKQNLTLIEKKCAFVNLANIFDDFFQYDLAVKYLNKALQIDNKDGVVYHNLGIVYKHKKDYKKAAESLCMAVKYNKNFVKSYLSLASLYFYLKDYRHSFKYYKLASNLNPSNMEIKYNIGICYFKLGKVDKGMEALESIIKSEYISDAIKSESLKSLGIYFASKGNYEKALFYLKKASEIKIDYDVYYKLGTLYKIQGEYEQALNYYSMAYKLNNRDELTIKNLAELYFRFGDNNKALLYYKYIFDNFKAKTEILLMIGEIYLKKNDPIQAIQYYNKALEYSPTPYEAKIVYINLGNLYLEQKDYTEALSSYNKALEIDRMDVNIYYNISLIYIENNDIKNALKNLDEVIKLNPGSIKYYLLKSRLLYQSGKTKLSIINYNKMIEKFPSEIMPYFELSNLYYKLKDYNKAEHYLSIALDLKCGHNLLYKIYLNMSIIKNKKKLFNEAFKYISKAYMLNNKDPLINYNYGLIYFNSNQHKKARDYFYQAIRLPSQDYVKAMAYLGLGNIYFKEGKYDLAQSMYKKSLRFNPDFTEAHYNLKVVKEK